MANQFTATRESDERILDWLLRRRRGEPVRAIARQYKINPGIVSKSINKVLKEIR